MTRFFRASGMLAVGFALGVLTTGAGTALAVMGKTGWDRWGPMFKQGYAAGFNDVVRMAKTSDPQSFVAKTFRLPPTAKALDWVVMIDSLYADKENENRPLPQMFAIAGPRLEGKFGSEAEAQRRAFEQHNIPGNKAQSGSGAASSSPASGPDASPERTPKGPEPAAASTPAGSQPSAADKPTDKPADTKPAGAKPADTNQP